MSETIEAGVENICDVDVVIIGAGAAGLVAAYQLQQGSSALKFCVLEAKGLAMAARLTHTEIHRVGGRLYSAKIPSSDGYDEWDLGGQWVSSSQYNVMELLEDFGVEVYPQYMEGNNKLIIDNLSDIRTYSGLIPKLGILELLDINRLMEKVESMVKKISLKEPLDCKNFSEWDNQTVDGMARKEASFAVVKRLFDVAIRTVFGCESSQMSVFFLLYYAALAGGFNELLDTKKGTAQEFRVKGTMYGVIRQLADKVGIENIKTSDPVSVIQQCGDSAVLVRTVKGRLYRSKYVVCAIPSHLVNKIHFNPPLPFNRQQLNQRTPMGNMIKCLATYKRAFWREKKLSGQSVATVQNYAEGVICATFDATTSNGSPALLSFIAGEQAYYWSQKTELDRKQAVLDYLAAVFGDEAKTDLIAYVDKDWSQEDYNGGCPAGIMQPGSFAYFQHALRKPFGRIHFAGTETARRWMGYIDGAVESGKRAAEEIRSRMEFPNETFSDDIATPSPVFGKKPRQSSNTGCKLIGALVAGAVVGAVGYYCIKNYN